MFPLGQEEPSTAHICQPLQPSLPLNSSPATIPSSCVTLEPQEPSEKVSFLWSLEGLKVVLSAKPPSPSLQALARVTTVVIIPTMVWGPRIFLIQSVSGTPVCSVLPQCLTSTYSVPQECVQATETHKGLEPCTCCVEGTVH